MTTTSGQLRTAARAQSAPDQQTTGTPTTISALPVKVDLDLYQGDDFYLDITVTNPDGSNADLSAATPSAQIRVAPNDATILCAFTASVAANVIHLHLPHTESTKLLAATVWDCQIATPDITTLVAGTVTTTLEVTRP